MTTIIIPINRRYIKGEKEEKCRFCDCYFETERGRDVHQNMMHKPDDKVWTTCDNCGRDTLIEPPTGGVEFCSKHCELEYGGVIFIPKELFEDE